MAVNLSSHELLWGQWARGITTRKVLMRLPWLLLLCFAASCCAYNDHRNPSRPLVWGVDLGNHNSVAATASKAGVEVILNDVAGRSTPSAVFFTGTARLVGEHTVTSCGSNPSNLVNNFKALLPDDDSLASSRSGNTNDPAAKDADAGEEAEEGSGPGFWPPWGVLAYRVRRDKRGSGGGAGAAAVPPRAVVRHGGGELELLARDAFGTLLAHLERLAEADGGVRNSCVVAGVPSYYSRRQRRALLDAARVQGVPLTALIDEGQAAALAYGIFKRGLPPPSPVGTARAVPGEASADAGGVASAAANGEGGSASLAAAATAGAAAKAKERAKAKGPLIVAFVDIGHTCTQVTVAAFTSAGLDILGRGCARNCGAGTVERRVFDILYEKAVEAVGAEAAATPRATFRLARAAAAAVKTLSANKEARATIECLDGETDVTAVLTRAELEAGCAKLALGAAAACRAALAAAGLPAAAVAEAELLGGGSYIPLLQKGVEEVFGAANVPVRRTMNAAESVATGCALAAARHSALFKLRPFAVTDRLAATLKVTYRWVAPKSSDTGTADVCGELLLTVPRGSVVPWTTDTRVPLPVGEESGSWKLEVTVTEGREAVAAFSIDVPHADAEKQADNYSAGTAKKEAEDILNSAGEAAAAAAASSRYAVSFSLRVDEFGDVVLEHAREELLPPGRRHGKTSENAENAEEAAAAAAEAAAAAAGKGEAGAPAGLAAAVAVARTRRRIRERQNSYNGGGSILGRSLHTQQTLSGLLSGAELDEARGRETVLREQDRAAADAAEARNALEDLLYATRRRLQPTENNNPAAESSAANSSPEVEVEVEAGGEGDLSPYATAAEAAAALRRLGEVEDALLRGSLQGKQNCQALAEELQELTALPEARKTAFVELLSVLEDFEQALLIREHSFYEASDRLSPAERRRLQAELAKAQGWVTASRNRLESMAAASQQPRSGYGARAGKLPLTSAQVRRKLEQLMQAFDEALPAGAAEESGKEELRAPEAAPP